MPLDRKAVAHIATLARISVPEAELDALAGELDQILHWVEQLGEVDTGDVAPMSGVGRARLPRRDDRVTDGDCRDAILGNAPQSAPNGPNRGFFAVPKVVE